MGFCAVCVVHRLQSITYRSWIIVANYSHAAQRVCITPNPLPKIAIVLLAQHVANFHRGQSHITTLHSRTKSASPPQQYTNVRSRCSVHLVQTRRPRGVRHSPRPRHVHPSTCAATRLSHTDCRAATCHLHTDAFGRMLTDARIGTLQGEESEWPMHPLKVWQGVMVDATWIAKAAEDTSATLAACQSFVLGLTPWALFRRNNGQATLPLSGLRARHALLVVSLACWFRVPALYQCPATVALALSWLIVFFYCAVG